jgi:hypothetical protein
LSLFSAHRTKFATEQQQLLTNLQQRLIDQRKQDETVKLDLIREAAEHAAKVEQYENKINMIREYVGDCILIVRRCFFCRFFL